MKDNYVGRDRGDTAGDSGSLVKTTVLLLRPTPGCDGGEFPFGCDGGSSSVEGSRSSGIGAQYVFRTCFKAGRLIGLDKKKSMPES